MAAAFGIPEDKRAWAKATLALMGRSMGYGTMERMAKVWRYSASELLNVANEYIDESAKLDRTAKWNVWTGSSSYLEQSSK